MLQVCDSSTPCLNEGKCSNGVCTCPQFFSGSRCEKVNAPLCATNICSNGGTCFQLNTKLYCACPPNFTGQYCEQM